VGYGAPCTLAIQTGFVGTDFVVIRLGQGLSFFLIDVFCVLLCFVLVSFLSPPQHNPHIFIIIITVIGIIINGDNLLYRTWEFVMAFCA
jgi:hypothetical protein